MRFHLYIFFTVFCVHSLFCFSFHYAYLMSNCCFSHLSKNDKRGWLTRWPPRSFANPIWHSAPLCLHWSTIVPLCFHLLYCSLTIGLLYAMALMMLLLVGWVIWNNKPLTIQSITIAQKTVIDCNRLGLTITITPCPRPGNMSQNGLNTTSLIRSLTKIPLPPTKNFLSRAD